MPNNTTNMLTPEQIRQAEAQALRNVADDPEYQMRLAVLQQAVPQAELDRRAKEQSPGLMNIADYERRERAEQDTIEEARAKGDY